jgi:hypothetical protein
MRQAALLILLSAAVPAAAFDPSTLTPPPAQESQAAKVGIAGVWMSFRPVMAGSWELGPRWYTFFQDGQVYQDLPRAGLAGFDRNASRSDPNQRDYWGNWKYEKGSGLITKPGVSVPEALRLESAVLMAIDSYKFSRCVGVDGLRLEGAWTSFADPDDPDLARLPKPRPVLRFTRDGKFVDEGVFETFLSGVGTEPNGRPGAGAYEIGDFTLTLRYTDGRTQRIAFSGLLSAEPTVQNDIIFIGRGRFNRMKK